MKSVELQQKVEIGWRGDTPTRVRFTGCALKVSFVEIDQARRWIHTPYGCRFQNFVVKRDG